MLLAELIQKELFGISDDLTRVGTNCVERAGFVAGPERWWVHPFTTRSSFPCFFSPYVASVFEVEPRNASLQKLAVCGFPGCFILERRPGIATKPLLDSLRRSFFIECSRAYDQLVIGGLKDRSPFYKFCQVEGAAGDAKLLNCLDRDKRTVLGNLMFGFVCRMKDGISDVDRCLCQLRQRLPVQVEGPQAKRNWQIYLD